MAAVEKIICPPNCGLSVPEQPTTPKPRCDAQGRLLSAPENGINVYMLLSKSIDEDTWGNSSIDQGFLIQGAYFISQPAAEAELTRLKCLQRLRGMEGFSPFGGCGLWSDGFRVTGFFETLRHCEAAEATITPEERAAFLYREPMGEE